MNPKVPKLLAYANEALKRVDPGMNDPQLQDLKTAVANLLEAFELTQAPRRPFTARVLQSGMIVIPKDVRAVDGVTVGDTVTLDLLGVEYKEEAKGQAAIAPTA